MLFVFDFDGTIMDTALGVTRCAQNTMVRLGYPEYPLEKFLVFMGPPINYSFREYAKLPEEEIEQAVGYFRERYRDVGKFEAYVYPGIPALLEKLKHAGHKITVASAKPEVYVREIMDHFGILAYFDSVVGASMVETMADKAKNIRKAMDTLGYLDRPEEVWMIGDRKDDIDGAREVGLKSVGVTYGYGSREELEAAGADIIVETVADLESLLLQAR